jgi:hypothetical protein
LENVNLEPDNVEETFDRENELLDEGFQDDTDPTLPPVNIVTPVNTPVKKKPTSRQKTPSKRTTPPPQARPMRPILPIHDDDTIPCE